MEAVARAKAGMDSVPKPTLPLSLPLTLPSIPIAVPLEVLNTLPSALPSLPLALPSTLPPSLPLPPASSGLVPSLSSWRPGTYAMPISTYALNLFVA